MIHFYGSPASSSGRTHVMLEECSVAYEYHQVNLRDPAKRTEYEAINPSGKVPFLVDGELRLVESIAINFYLAEQYKPEMWATDLHERARIYSWSLWCISMLQREAMRVLDHRARVPAEHRSQYEVDTGTANMARYLDQLERDVPSSGYLVGGRYTVADLNVASVVNLAAALGVTLGDRTKEWMTTCKSRPAWKKVAAAG